MWRGFSWKPLVISYHKSMAVFHRNRHQIPWRFHVIHPDFICFPCWNMNEFWTSSSHGISMAFAKKMMGFPSDLVSFSNQTKLPSKRHEKIHVTFLTGKILILFMYLVSGSTLNVDFAFFLLNFHFNIIFFLY